MGRTFDQEDVFPIIARLINSATSPAGAFITSREIATALLTDDEGRRVIQAAIDRRKDPMSAEQIACNMVSWFSQRITVRLSDYAVLFERCKVKEVWAYRPKDTVTHEQMTVSKTCPSGGAMRLPAVTESHRNQC